MSEIPDDVGGLYEGATARLEQRRAEIHHFVWELGVLREKAIEFDFTREEAMDMVLEVLNARHRGKPEEDEDNG